MKAFDVSISGEKVATAGIAAEGVLTSILTFAIRKGGAEHLEFRLGGMDSKSGDHFEWAYREPSVGDVLTIRIVDVPEVDEPEKRVIDDGDSVEQEERRYHEALKKRHGDA